MVRSVSMAATASITLAVLGWIIFRWAGQGGNMQERASPPVPNAADIHVPPPPFAAYGH